MSMTQFDALTIARATSLLDAAYADYFARSDGYAKSSEGLVTITGGTYFQRQEENAAELFTIEVFSYVFASGPPLGRSFSGIAAADQFLQWAQQVHDEQLAREYDANRDEIHRDENGQPIDVWAGLDS